MVGLLATKVYSATGADIVMESFALIGPDVPWLVQTGFIANCGGLAITNSDVTLITDITGSFVWH